MLACYYDGHTPWDGGRVTERELSTGPADARRCNAILDLLHLRYYLEIILFPRDVPG